MNLHTYNPKNKTPISIRRLCKTIKEQNIPEKEIVVKPIVDTNLYTPIKLSTKKIITKYSYLVSKGVLYFRLETPQVYETTNLSGLLSIEHGDFTYDTKELVGLFQIINLRKI